MQQTRKNPIETESSVGELEAERKSACSINVIARFANDRFQARGYNTSIPGINSGVKLPLRYKTLMRVWPIQIM